MTDNFFLFLPGSVLEPGFTTRPRARMISTSNCPFLSIMPTWMSPNDAGEEEEAAGGGGGKQIFVISPKALV